MQKINWKENMTPSEYLQYTLYCKVACKRALPQDYHFELIGDMANEFNRANSIEEWEDYEEDVPDFDCMY